MKFKAALATTYEQTLVEQNIENVRIIAQELDRIMPPHIEYDDLFSSGMIGLIDAAKKFDPSRNVRFKTYAEYRIRGAMLDWLRTMDTSSRSTSDHRKKYETAANEIMGKLGRPPEPHEVAKALGITVDEVFDLYLMIRPVAVLSIDQTSDLHSHDRRSLLEKITLDRNEDDIIVSQIHRKRQMAIVSAYIKNQQPKHTGILEGYFFSGIKMNKLGKMFRVSESRVSQIIALHSSRMKRLFEEYEQTG